MKFVITGHKGLIGSFLLQRLGEPVLSIDLRDGKNVLNIDKTKCHADVFIHLASFCKINQSIVDPSSVFENNARGTEKVMEFCRKNKIPKIVFTSSSRVLSKEKNPYTASKLYGEELVKGYSQCYGIDYTIIRPSTVYGPFDDRTKRLVDVFILNALCGKELKIFGDENKTLDFTYIDDYIDGLLLAKDQKNEEFDISSGSETKISEVADLIIRLAGGGEKGFYPPEVAQPQEVSLDISKIRALGYCPKVGIEIGIRRTFAWYSNHLSEILAYRS